jgi:hypothetical protein
MARKVNLTMLLKHLDLRNQALYEALRHNEEERKELDRMLAYILPLWMSGATDPKEQIRLALSFNQHVNISWWELDGHPELRAKILAAIGPGRVIRHDFQARTNTKITALKDLLSRLYPDIRQDEVQLWCSKNSEATLIELCSDLGMQEKERDTIITEYRNTVS